MTDWAKHFREVSRRRAQPVATFGGPVPDFGADPNVLSVQQSLNRLGTKPSLKEDGIWGHATQSALASYQKTHGLIITKVIDKLSLDSLGIKPVPLPPIPRTNVPPIPGIRPVVVESFPAFSTAFEGALPYMYTDIKGKVTTGIGNLIDSPQDAIALPWIHPDTGAPATAQEVTDAWNAVKHAFPGIQSTACQSLTNIRLSSDAIANLIQQKMRSNHQVLSQEYPDYSHWPADAQLALHSLSWAWGPAFASVWNKYQPNTQGTAFKTAVNASTPDFAKAADVMTAASAHEESINPGIIPRNAANRKLFSNAATVIASNSDPDSLFFPNDLLSGLASFAKAHVVLGSGIVLGMIAFGVGVLALSKRG